MNIKQFILSKIKKHPADIVNLAMKQYRISRPAVHKHLKRLIREGKVTAMGRTRNKTYNLASEHKVSLSVPVSQTLEETQLWNSQLKPAASRLPPNIAEICEYGFTEMVNNVIDHSRAKTLAIKADFAGKEIILAITDDGIGAFGHIRKALKLGTIRESILHLSKGKVTTDPSRHTGEGIFFTSRMFDRFSMESDGVRYARFADGDWLVDNAPTKKGTHVVLSISRESRKKTKEVFDRFADAGGDFTFSKTEVIVQLGLIPGETYISRSQARRILAGLEKFKRVVLDFRRVEAIGQGFVDEVFRVFHHRHPSIKIEWTNANENVEFMIRRGLGDQTPD